MTDEEKATYYRLIGAASDAMTEAGALWKRGDLSNEEKSARWTQMAKKATELHETAMKYLRSVE